MMLEAIPFSSPWPQAFASVWPGRTRPWLVHDRSVFAPFIRLEGRTFDEWLASKSYHFRKHSRSARRSLEKRGAIVRVVTEPDELTAAVEELVRLHRARWDWRGGTAVLDDRSEPMLVEAGRGLLAEARFRLVRVDVDGRAIGSFLCLAAGGEVAACLSGHDDAWAAHSPSGVALIASIEQACSLGDVRFDLGGGRQSYKYRFADGEESLAWWTLVLPGPRYLETRLRLALRRGYRRTSSGLARRLPRDIKRRLKNLMRGRGSSVP
jgi:CelD/BcsL family acetyltransferase involved in cellulose biosynthesis